MSQYLEASTVTESNAWANMKTFKRVKISKSASVFLDSLRIIASLLVLVHHATQQWLSTYPNAVKQLETIAHASVIIFFVLSGYFISFATIDTNLNFKKYAVARLSRLYSVLVPALLITAIIEIFVKFINPELANYYLRGNSPIRYVLSIVFCNEIGWISAAPPINGPLWSLSYEFWYYVIFGLLFYYGRTKKGIILTIIACVVAGPKILLLMPIWIFGMMFYFISKKHINIKKSWTSVFIILGIAASLVVYLPAMPFELGFKPLFFANQFLKDWLVGAVFTFTLVFVPDEDISMKESFVIKIRKIADLSFPLYILHYPILVLWQAIFVRKANDIVQMCEAMITAIILSILIGGVLERKRYKWIEFFEKIVNHFKILVNN